MSFGGNTDIGVQKNNEHYHHYQQGRILIGATFFNLQIQTAIP